MPYPKKLLNDYETMALDLHPHWWYFAKSVAALVASIILGIVVLAMTDGDTRTILGWVSLAALVLSALWVLKTYASWSTTNFVITSDRIIYRVGVVAKSGMEMPLERVNNVMSNQTIFERLVGAGDLMIESGGEEGQQRFTDIRNPQRVQNMIHAQMESNEARKFGGLQNAGTDVATQLEKLEGMLERGTLTQAEFDAQKQHLLGGGPPTAP
ncbi:MAG TPA: PH domain-containing protein [Ilumatobacter sp.]|nr:PH domain-containing protein [Ilumatobacter sp.]